MITIPETVMSMEGLGHLSTKNTRSIKNIRNTNIIMTGMMIDNNYIALHSYGQMENKAIYCYLLLKETCHIGLLLING